MTPDQLLREEAAKWLRQAAKDQHAAQVLLEPEPSRSVFHSQQAAEKAVKALLMYRGMDVWGHAITPMLRSLKDLTVTPQLIEQAQLLDTFYIPTRYPNGFPQGKPADYYGSAKAQEAFDAASDIIQFCEDHLPRST